MSSLCKIGLWMLFCLLLCTVEGPARGVTTKDADALFAAYNQAFYHTESTNAFYRATTSGDKPGFWQRAEEMEMLLDVYEHTTNTVCLTMFSNLFNGFVADNGGDWSTNQYNDDIMWMVIACARGYRHTGNPAFRDAAKTNFDLCYARAWSTNLNGGLWWTTTNGSKNACVNGPAAIASYLLYQILDDTGYRAKAEGIYQWECATLFDTNMGAVFDAISADGEIHPSPTTYNQGTFIGAANLLGYTNDALRAADFTMNQLCREGLLPRYREDGDGGGFNGICVRWLAKFMDDRGLASRYGAWLRRNAGAAWDARRKSDNLAWCRWPRPTSEGVQFSWSCSSALVVMYAGASVPETVPAESLPLESQTNHYPPDDLQVLERTCFQTGKEWSAKADLCADVAIAYGIDPSLPERIESWREHGYRIHVMTGAAWGQYQDYLYGRFDGINHEDEAQTERNGKKISHGGDVYYMCPGTNYGKFLCVGVQRALDAGAEAIHLEEPEFWDRAGYSEGFKREWTNFYGEAWQPPHSSVDARWRAGKLKYFLYRRALQQVFDYVRAYNQRTGRRVRCYVPTHSLLNYSQWCIVSPESSLAQLDGCDGYIAQVWTGISREPNRYRGEVRSRTFETAFLEYGAMQNLVRATGRSVWYLNDPIEDNPNYDWTDYRTNWESTMTASLLQPEVSQYEIAPWPERIFNGHYPRSAPYEDRKSIPQSYATELQIVFNALKDMKQPRVEWDCGTAGVGVLASDSMMFQRGEPTPSDPHLGNFYGLAMPLLMRGVPVAPVQLETVTVPHCLEGFRILFLSYDGQKPLAPAVHDPLAAWVKSGGVLIFCDKDADPYLNVREWWNGGANKFTTPRQHLFEKLGVDDSVAPETFHRVGKGGLIWLRERPAKFSASAGGADQVAAAAKLAAQNIGLMWRESNYLLLRRGPYVIASGLDETAGKPHELTGRYVNLFDPGLQMQEKLSLTSGARKFLIDLDVSSSGGPHLLAAACRALPGKQTSEHLVYSVEGISKTASVMLLSSPNPPKAVTLAGKQVESIEYSAKERLLWIHFENEPVPRELSVQY